MGGHNPVEKVAAVRWIRRPDSRGKDGQNQWNKHAVIGNPPCGADFSDQELEYLYPGILRSTDYI